MSSEPEVGLHRLNSQLHQALASSPWGSALSIHFLLPVCLISPRKAEVGWISGRKGSRRAKGEVAVTLGGLDEELVRRCTDQAAAPP